MNDAIPTTYSYYKAYSSVKRPFNKKIVNYNRYFNKRVNTVKGTRVSSAMLKAEVNTVKASASSVWKPKHEELDHVSKSDSASKTLTRYDYIDAYGRFKYLAITLIKELKIYSEVGTTSGIRADAEYRKLLAAQKNNMHVNNKSDMVTSCSKTCIDSHNKLKNLCDKQKNQLGVYEVEIVAYKEDVKKLEGQVVAYQKQQLSYEEKLKLQANHLYDKKLQIEKYKKTTEKALKEKEELETRLESFDTSSKSLNTMHNSQLIAKDKAGFGHDGVKESKVKRVWNNSRRVNHQNFGGFSHPNPKNNIVPQAVLTKSGLVTLNSARPINTVKPIKTMNDAMPITYSYYKAYSSVKRPFNKKTVNYNRYFNKRVNTIKGTRVSSARTKAEVNTIKASAG
ncbi:hypothetical protein Tco_0878535 [Tanacetum coccineum]|uniref:Uncharacterized protein n=1 Tax=Tanacetum coccineum TaxID=301880 RepID=A0ABQ5C3K0_9ASTR